ncbi:hypothetical protein ATCC90586_011903 [Pythium insidiosum]|nr:hypothetical protein ATCC90586_011903 [Pythium insidiosum]
MRVEPVAGLAALRTPEVHGYQAVQTYPQGDACERREGNGSVARRVAIQYKCCVFRANETYIEAVDEPARCAYVLAVCTPAACGLVTRDQYVLNAPAVVSDDERRALAQTVRDMFYHAYNGYLAHAFPRDALKPVTCAGAAFELGQIEMLTLIDTLDTLAILEDGPAFRHAVALVVARSSFDLDTAVSVFETTIRVLGGLLSAHLFAEDPARGLFAPGAYRGELLALARDLGDRLLPAFATPTGIPSPC